MPRRSATPSSTRSSRRPSRSRARRRCATPRHAALRRPADRRHGPPPGQDRRDEDRRGQDAGRHPARVPERPDRPRRPRRHRQRLPGPPRRRVDGPRSTVSSGLTVGCIQNNLLDDERQAAYALRRHLRHEQRVRLRLPARQHEVRAREHGPARPRLRDRRRGRLDPHRRGAHAAHHLRARRRRTPTSTTVQPRHPAPRQGHRGEGQGRQQDDDRRLPRRREGPHRRADRRGRGEGREARSASTTCTSRRTSTCSTASSRPCGPTRSTSATSTT